MVHIAYCACTKGMEVVLVRVEVDVSSGIPSFQIAGLVGSEVREAAERIRIAIRSAGYSFPPRRITVNLSPADVRKNGTGFDLAIAAGILAGLGILPSTSFSRRLFLGELSLDGTVHGIPGILPIVLAGVKAGIREFFLPTEGAKEGSLAGSGEIYPVSSLEEFILMMQGKLPLSPLPKTLEESMVPVEEECLEDVAGQTSAKRAAVIAAAGRHHLLLFGPPGSGKTMIAKRIPGLLLPMTREEQLEVTKVYSVAGLLQEGDMIVRRPFRMPHYHITGPALIGGGKIPHPGEISLAEHGILFLDELPEFSRNTLEAMRVPLEEPEIVISRQRGQYAFPTHFMLVAAMNLCPCGAYPDEERCVCSPGDRKRYQGRVSKALLDRLDLMAQTEPLTGEMLRGKKEKGEEKRAREAIGCACERQLFRYQKEGIRYNSQASNPVVEEKISLGSTEERQLESFLNAGKISARGYYKVKRIARTIGDLEDTERITSAHLAEALYFHMTDELEGKGSL